MRVLRDELQRMPDAAAFVAFKSHDPVVWLLDVKVVQDLYTIHNKFFDKHPIAREVTYELLGGSILFADTNEMWRKRRTALSPAFYKGKLVQMVETAKASMRVTLAEWHHKDSSRIDLVHEISLMFTRLLLRCAIGESLDGVTINFWQKGKVRKVEVQYALRTCVQEMIDRLYHLHVYFCSSLATQYIFPYERDILANCREIRSLFHKMVEKRRKELIEDPHTKEGDLLSILLSDPLFNTENEMIVDEVLTFFTAGSQTSAITTQNLVLHLLKHPHYKD